MAPFFGLLAFWMFGLDERVAAPRDRSTRRRFCQVDTNGLRRFSDPDGRTVRIRGPVTPPPPYAPGSRELACSESVPQRSSGAAKNLSM
jgi:hypothetical protein